MHRDGGYSPVGRTDDVDVEVGQHMATGRIRRSARRGLAAAVANQVVTTVAASLPPVPAPVPYVVETLVPLPTLPGANLPQLPQVNVQVPTLPGTPTSPVPGGVVPVTPPAAGGAPAPA